MPDLIPWGVKEVSKLKDDMDRLFDALFEDLGLPPAVMPGRGVSLVQSAGGWTVTCDMPGFEPEDVAVTVCGRALSIAAARRDQEGGYERLSRRLTLPLPISMAEAGFTDGRLTIRIQCQPPPSAQRVPVVRR